MQERRNSIANALELRHSCTNPSKWYLLFDLDCALTQGSDFESKHYNDTIMGAIASQIIQPHDCLLNCLFRRITKKTSNLRVTCFARGINRWPLNSPHKGSVTRKMFPFDDVIMRGQVVLLWCATNSNTGVIASDVIITSLLRQNDVILK